MIQLKAISTIRKSNLQLIGNFHSHPSTPARPSAEDIRLAFDPTLSYVIISLQDLEHPTIKSFLIKEQTSTIEQLNVVG